MFHSISLHLLNMQIFFKSVKIYQKNLNFEHSNVTAHHHLLRLKSDVEFKYRFSDPQKSLWKLDWKKFHPLSQK